MGAFAGLGLVVGRSHFLVDKKHRLGLRVFRKSPLAVSGRESLEK